MPPRLCGATLVDTDGFEWVCDRDPHAPDEHHASRVVFGSESQGPMWGVLAWASDKDNVPLAALGVDTYT